MAILAPGEGTFGAVDQGASSGRVMAARVGRDRLDLREVHRFPNRPVRLGERLHWDVLALYISCGTWSLVGVELPDPVLTEQSRLAGFANELGVDGTVRYLHNVMGLWLLQESQRTWAAAGLPADLPDLLAAAGQVPAFTAVVDADDPRFLPPGDLPARIAAVCTETGQTPPQSRAETVRCILDSLALAYRRTVRAAEELSGRAVEPLHLVGGGARNALLCQLTADACGRPVVAGPVEAAALGNVLVPGSRAGRARRRTRCAAPAGPDDAKGAHLLPVAVRGGGLGRRRGAAGGGSRLGSPA